MLFTYEYRILHIFAKLSKYLYCKTNLRICVMKKKDFLKSALSLFAMVLLISCSKSDNGTVEYVPFQESKDGQWGMISMDGKVLFQEEFKKAPTMVRDGRFFASNKDGLWEMYEAQEKPKKIGAEYAHVSSFCNGRAVVAEKNKPVSIIATDGSTVKKLDRVAGKEVDGVSALYEDYAVFMTMDSLFGVVDKDGDCVVKPEYYFLTNCGSGKFLGINNKYKAALKKKQKDKYRISVLNTKGDVLFEFSGNKYEDIKSRFFADKLAVSVKKDGKEAWGIINDKGETVVKPSSKLKKIGAIHDDVFTYYNGDAWGLMNIKGETLIRAKYDELYYDQDDRLLAAKKKGDDYEYRYIDMEDNKIGDDTYVDAYLFSSFDGKHAWVKLDDKIYSLIDTDGKQLEHLPDIVDVEFSDGEKYIESDYVDLDKLVSKLNISKTGLLTFTFNSGPKDVVKKAMALGYDAMSDAQHPAGTPYWYDMSSGINFNKDFDGVNVALSIDFNGVLSRQTYRTERVIDYVYYGYYEDYYYYHDNQIPTGYVWNSVTPSVFRMEISDEGRMRYKMRDLYNLLNKKFKGMGSIVKQNDNAIVVNLGNGYGALVAVTKHKVLAKWGKLGSLTGIDITKYATIENDNDEDRAYDGATDDYADADSAAVDSCYADSVAAW